jgi:hypothetical protein
MPRLGPKLRYKARQIQLLLATIGGYILAPLIVGLFIAGAIGSALAGLWSLIERLYHVF